MHTTYGLSRLYLYIYTHKCVIITIKGKGATTLRRSKGWGGVGDMRRDKGREEREW